MRVYACLTSRAANRQKFSSAIPPEDLIYNGETTRERERDSRTDRKSNAPRLPIGYKLATSKRDANACFQSLLASGYVLTDVQRCAEV